MIITKAYKTRIYPTPGQEAKIRKTLGCCRFIYNHMLERNQKLYKRKKKHLSYYDMQNLLPVMKGYLPWLKEADSQALKFACRQLNDAYGKFFRKQGGFPKFKKKRGRQSYTTTAVKQIAWEPGQVKLPCLGEICMKDKRKLPKNCKICRATVSLDPDGRYYVSVSFQYEELVPDRPVAESSTIGLDYQVGCLYVDSSGNRKSFPHWYQDSLMKLAREQKNLSRKQGSRKGEKRSGRYKKQLKKVAALQSKISRQRQDLLQKTSTQITNSYSVICIEDLSIKDMMNITGPFTKRQKKWIRMAVLNTGWYGFTQMLVYKQKYSGGKVIKAGKYFKSSQTCSCCGSVNPDVKDLSVRTWTCPECGSKHDRDINAAKNIKSEGLRILIKL
ncbi:MAG: transposase [Lachnospiraceae bacterium]|nr:transposase [Lachnospiraceae bacterium]